MPGFFAPAIEKSGELIVPTIVVFEVYKRVYQQRDRHAALQAIATLRAGRIVDSHAKVGNRRSSDEQFRKTSDGRQRYSGDSTRRERGALDAKTPTSNT